MMILDRLLYYGRYHDRGFGDDWYDIIVGPPTNDSIIGPVYMIDKKTPHSVEYEVLGVVCCLIQNKTTKQNSVFSG